MSLQTARSLFGLMQSQWWDQEKLQQHQLQRLNHVLQLARSHSPFYRKLYRAHACPDTLQSLDDVQRLPIIRKSDLQHAGATVLNSKQSNDAHAVQTGGSTGKVLTVTIDKAHRKRRVASIYRTLIAHGYRPQHKLLYGQQYPGGAGAIEKLGLLRTYGLNLQDSPRDWLQILLAEKPEFLSGHASIFSEIGQLLLNSGSDYMPQTLICNSEMLTPSRARIIESAFGVKPTNVYDCWEAGTIAWQCPEHGGLHINADLVYVELLDDGKVVITDLYNEAMPLIRYEIGDSAEAMDESCPCGRHLPMLKNIVGKSHEAIVLGDGSESACAQRIALSLYERFPEMDEMQIQQCTAGELSIIMQSQSWNNADIQTMEQHLANKFGLTRINILDSNAFFETAAGKRPIFYSTLKHGDSKAA
jgi:phenylacetate-CoA ligase